MRKPWLLPALWRREIPCEAVAPPRHSPPRGLNTPTILGNIIFPLEQATVGPEGY